MTRIPGAFFQYPISTKEILGYLERNNQFFELSNCSRELQVMGVCDSRGGGDGQLVFSTGQNYSKASGLAESLVLIDDYPDKDQMGSNQFLKVTDPRAVYIDLLEWLIMHVGVDAHMVAFRERAVIANGADINTHAIVEPGVEIGAGSKICAGAVIKTGTRIGENTVVRENVVIGCDGVTLYRTKDDRLLKFPHVGGVAIGNNTEIGANAVIAGGILSPTSIGNDVVIGNLCNIGHGVVVGDGVWMSVGSLIGGHTVIQAGATLAMGVSVRDNLVIGECASLGMGSVVVKSVGHGHSMFGNPAKRMPGLKTGPQR